MPPRIVPQLRGAMQELRAAGLGHLIRSFHGCFVPRFISRDPTSLLSHHSWGIAFDTNLAGNYYGDPPHQDPRLVDVLDDWGFLWGGLFVVPDGEPLRVPTLAGAELSEGPPTPSALRYWSAPPRARRRTRRRPRPGRSRRPARRPVRSSRAGDRRGSPAPSRRSARSCRAATRRSPPTASPSTVSAGQAAAVVVARALAALVGQEHVERASSASTTMSPRSDDATSTVVATGSSVGDGASDSSVGEGSCVGGLGSSSPEHAAVNPNTATTTRLLMHDDL